MFEGDKWLFFLHFDKYLAFAVKKILWKTLRRCDDDELRGERAVQINHTLIQFLPLWDVSHIQGFKSRGMDSGPDLHLKFS